MKMRSGDNQVGACDTTYSERVTRRHFLRTGALAAFGGSLVWQTMGCERRRTLRVANWADFIAPSTIPRFEEEVGCVVLYDNYSSNEELRAKLVSRPDSYDVVFPSDYMVEQLRNERLLQPIPKDRLGNLEHLNQELLGLPYDSGNEYSLPYAYWGTGIAVNSKRVTLREREEITWGILHRSEVAGRVTLLDEMRYTLGMALLALGESVNSVDPHVIDRAADIVIEIKPNLMGFVTDVKDLLIRGEVAVAYAYSGDVFQASEVNEAITFNMPQGGGIIGVDNMCITARAANLDLVTAFIDFILRPDVAAEITTSTYYATANGTALSRNLIPAPLQTNPAIYVPIGSGDNRNVLRGLSSEEADLYVDAWDKVKRA